MSLLRDTINWPLSTDMPTGLFVMLVPRRHRPLSIALFGRSQPDVPPTDTVAHDAVVPLVVRFTSIARLAWQCGRKGRGSDKRGRGYLGAVVTVVCVAAVTVAPVMLCVPV